MLRVNNGVLVVPPFECAWLTGEGYTLRSGAGCLSFEAKGDTDVTVILKSTPGAKRLQPLLRQAPSHAQGHGTGGNALQVEQNYTIIFGSHRNSCLKIEKNGVTQCMVTGVACSRVSNKTFSKYWIDLKHGVLTIGHGELGEGVCHQWRDTQEIPGIQHIGLSCWDRHVSYRSMALQPPLDFTRLQQAQLSGAASAVPSLFDATCAAIMAAMNPLNVCRTLHVAELLLPTTQKLYRYCLNYIARHLEAVVDVQQQQHQGSDQQMSYDSMPYGYSYDDEAPQQHQLRHVSAAAMCDLVCQNTFSVDEQGIYAAVRDWAWSYVMAHAGERLGSVDGDEASVRHYGRVDEFQRDVERETASRQFSFNRCDGSAGVAGVPAPPVYAYGRASLDAGLILAARTLGSAAASALVGHLPGRASPWRGPSSGGDGGEGSSGGASTASPSAASKDDQEANAGAGVVSAGAAATPVAPGTPQQLSPASRGGAMSTEPDGATVRAAGEPAAGFGALSRRCSSPGPYARTQPLKPPGVWLGGCVVSAAEEAACRVLCLIRFPLLPIESLQACLSDPLLQRLPAVLELVHEALEVHCRETGVGMGITTTAGGAGLVGGADLATALPSHPYSRYLQPMAAAAVAAAAATSGGGSGAAVTPSNGLAARCTSMPAPASERRLVKPLPTVGSMTASTVHDAGAGPGVGGAAATAGVSGVGPSTGGNAGGVGAGGHHHPAPVCGPAGVVGGGAGVVGSTGGGGNDTNWSVRFQRRCLVMARELEYVCDGDTSGVLHYLGTQYGNQGWLNPMLAKRVDVRASSPTGRTTDPRVIVGRQFVRTNFAGPRYVNGAAVSWWQVDLGEPHQLAISYYTLRHDGSQDFARSWVLQGSHDLTTWVDLKRHTHDTTIKVPGQYASWPVIGPAAAVPYRAFRLLLTAPNASSNPASRHNFCLSNLELYGFLHVGNSGVGGGGRTGGSGNAAANGNAAGGNGGSGHFVSMLGTGGGGGCTGAGVAGGGDGAGAAVSSTGVSSWVESSPAAGKSLASSVISPGPPVTAAAPAPPPACAASSAAATVAAVAAAVAATEAADGPAMQRGDEGDGAAGEMGASGTGGEGVATGGGGSGVNAGVGGG